MLCVAGYERKRRNVWRKKRSWTRASWRNKRSDKESAKSSTKLCTWRRHSSSLVTSWPTHGDTWRRHSSSSVRSWPTPSRSPTCSWCTRSDWKRPRRNCTKVNRDFTRLSSVTHCKSALRHTAGCGEFNGVYYPRAPESLITLAVTYS